MWEGYLNQWLLSYLGHFLEYNQEDLKAHALKGLGIQITGAKLKPEALDFLQLPVAVKEGRIGNLLVRCPWGFRGRIEVALSDVYVCACPWCEAQWEEGPAHKRRHAANMAQLGSAEVQKASKSLSGSSSARGGFGWSLLSWIGSILLNKLQLTVERVHVCLEVPDTNSSGSTSCCGLQLGVIKSAEAEALMKLSKFGKANKVGKVLKDMTVQQVSLYWHMQQTPSSPLGSGNLGDSMWQHVDHPADSVNPAVPHSQDQAKRSQAASVGISEADVDSSASVALSVSAPLTSESAAATASDRGTTAPEGNTTAADAHSTPQASATDVPPDALILHPMSCVVRVASLTDKRTGIARLNTLVAVDTIALQVNQRQLCDMARLADLFAVWQLHNRYASLRPTGWRSDPDAHIPTRRLWQYAVHAVLQDLGMQQPHKVSSQRLREWRRQRQRAHTRDAPASTTASPAPAAQDVDLSKAGLQKDAAHKSSDFRQGWWAWGMSALGYPPSKGDDLLDAPEGLPAGFSQEDLHELRTALSLDSFDLQHAPDAKDAARKLEIGADVKVEQIKLSVLNSSSQGSLELVSVELEQATTQVSLTPEVATLSVTVQEVLVQDCCTAGNKAAKSMLMRWQQPGSSSSSVDSVEQGTGMSTSSASLSSSFVVLPEMNAAAPLLKLQFVSQIAPSDSPKRAVLAGQQGSIEVWVQPLHLEYRSHCLSRLSGLLAEASQDTQAARLTQATNKLQDLNAHVLAQAQRALKLGSMPSISLQVENVMVSFGQQDKDTSAMCPVLQTGVMQVKHKPEEQSKDHVTKLVHHLEQLVHGSARLSPGEVQQLLQEVQTRLLYQRVQVSFASVQLDITAGSGLHLPSAHKRSAGSTVVLDPCRCAVSLDLHRIAGHAKLPDTKALVDVSGINIHLTPTAVGALSLALGDHQTLDSGANSQPQHALQEQAEGSPIAEVNVTAGVVSVLYNDTENSGKEADAKTIILKLRGSKLDLLLEQMQNAFAVKASVRHLHAVDKSKYTTKNPRIYGSHPVPRLAQMMEVDTLTVRVDHNQAEGLMVSGRLHGASAKGWSGESGNLITRLAANRPAQAEFTFYDTKERLQTSITLQDGCFGTATLMRIAALFMDAPATPTPLPPMAAPSAPTDRTPSAESATTAAPANALSPPADSDTTDEPVPQLCADSNGAIEPVGPSLQTSDRSPAGINPQASSPDAHSSSEGLDEHKGRASFADLTQSAAVEQTNDEPRNAAGMSEQPVSTSARAEERHELQHLLPDMYERGTAVDTDAGSNLAGQQGPADQQAAVSEHAAAGCPQAPQAIHAHARPADQQAAAFEHTAAARPNEAINAHAPHARPADTKPALATSGERQAGQAGLASAEVPSEQELWAAVVLGASKANQAEDAAAEQAASSAASAMRVLDSQTTVSLAQSDAQSSFAAAQTAEDLAQNDAQSTPVTAQTAVDLAQSAAQSSPAATQTAAAIPNAGAESTTEGNRDPDAASSPADATSEGAVPGLTRGHEHPQSVLQSDHAPAKPVHKRCEQFSIEIVRCKTVCPAKVASSSYTGADSPLPHTLYMDIPHLLLQLPLDQPAQHPRPHPVSLNVRHVLSGQQSAVPAPDSVAPSPFAADQQQGTICALTDLTLYVALPEEFDLAGSSHLRSTAHTHSQLPPLLSIPTASLLAVGPRPPPFNPSLRQGFPQRPVPALEFEMTLAKIIAKPAQLQTMSASTMRYSAEMDALLGKSLNSPLAPTPTPAASSHFAEAAAKSPAPQPGFALDISVGLISVQLHSSRKDCPALVLQWQRLVGHYAHAVSPTGSLPAQACFAPLACGLTWHYLALQLAQNPADQKQQQFSLEHVTTLRSASLLAPSRMSRAQSDPAMGLMGRAGSSRSSQPGSARAQKGSTLHGARHNIRSSLTGTVSPEEDPMPHQHGFSRLQVAPLGNARGVGLGGLTGLAADDDESIAESLPHIFNNRPRLASDSFAEALEALLPSNPSASSLPGQRQDEDAASNANLSEAGFCERRGRQRLVSDGAASVVSSRISIEQLQRQVPVIRHRPLLMASVPSDDLAMAPYASASLDLDNPAAAMFAASRELSMYQDALDNDSMYSSGGLQTGSRLKNWDAEELPTGDRLLLLLGSKSLFSDAAADAALEASVACSLLPDASAASSQLSLEICATDMVLRIYLEGWQLLIHSSHECFEAIARGRQHPEQGSARLPTAAPSSNNATATAQWASAWGSQVSVQLHATELVAELVANTRGADTLSPFVSVSTEVMVSSSCTEKGQLQHHLRVPRLAVATALMYLPPDIRAMVSRDNAGLLLGALGFEAVLTMPQGPATTGQSADRSESDQATQMRAASVNTLACLDVELQRMSVFASQRRLCIVAALVKVVDQVQEGLCRLAQPRSTVADITHASAAQRLPLYELLLHTRCSLQAHKLALLLSSDTHDDDTPIAETAAYSVILNVSGQQQPQKAALGGQLHPEGPQQQLACTCSMTLLLNVYNNVLMGWEPLLEPWGLALDVEIPLTRQGKQALSPQQLKVHLQADGILEVTLTPAVTSSYQASLAVLDALAVVAREPSTLENMILADEEEGEPGGEALYWLRNLTDAPLEFWLQTPGQLQNGPMVDLSVLGEPCRVPNRATHSLLPPSSSQTACKGCHVGDSKLFVAFPASSHSPSSPTSSLQLLDAADATDEQQNSGDLLVAQARSSSPPLGKGSLLSQEMVTALESNTDISVSSASSSNRSPCSTDVYDSATLQEASGLDETGGLVEDQQTAVLPRDTHPETQPSTWEQGNSQKAWLQQGVMCHRQAGMKVLVKLQGQGSAEQPLGGWALDRDQRSSTQVVLRKRSEEGIEVVQVFRVYCDISRGVRGGAGMTLHSGVKVTNSCAVWLCVGVKQNWFAKGSASQTPCGVAQEGREAPDEADDEPDATEVVAPGASIWLPALCCSATYVYLQPIEEDDSRPATHHWCTGQSLHQLLIVAQEASSGVRHQKLECEPRRKGGDQPAHFCLGAKALSASEGFSLLVKAPFELYNALPIPLNMSLMTAALPNMHSADDQDKDKGWRVTIPPLQNCPLHFVGSFGQLQKVRMEPVGFTPTHMMPVPRNGAASRDDLEGYKGLGKVTMDMSKTKREDGSASMALSHYKDMQTGSRALRVSCALWVFNCTGLPIALRERTDTEQAFGHADEEHVQSQEAPSRSIPTDWIHPYVGPSRRPPPRTPSLRRNPASYSPTHSSEASSMNPQSRFNLSGLGSVLNSPSGYRAGGHASSIASNPKGMTDTGQVAVLFQEPTRYASMQGTMGPHKPLQLCATTSTLSSGKALWSGLVHMNALGAAAVLEVPCPHNSVHHQKDALAGYRLAVTAVQIPDGDGALALHIMPRYILHNNLRQPLQYKQQGSSAESNLLAGSARAVHWSDISQKSLRLCIRLQETGQQWSGGFTLDTPGDLFVKLRHREHETTRLIRVDVSSSPNGVLAVALSEQAKGFAPYRLDNCTGLRLHLRQQGCLEQDDLLRPYSSLDYAWDEPALAHKLILEQPGGRPLGVYDLDKVGYCPPVLVSATSQRAEQRIQIRVRADGPRRVLELVDLLVHEQLSSAQQEFARAQLGWKPWSGSLYAGPVNRAAPRSPALAGTSLEVQINMAGLGLSMVGNHQEMLYGRVSGIQARAVTGVARQTVELAVQQLQVDNPAHDAAYPVAVTSPHTWSNFGRVVTAVAAAAKTGVPKPAALCLRWSVWRNRPGNVLCIERLEIQTAPILLEVEQAHFMQLMLLVQAVMGPLRQDSLISSRTRLPYEPELAVIRAGGRQHISTDKVHIECLHISQLLLTLSFMPYSGGASGMQRLLSIAGEVEGVSLRLAALEVHHPLLSQQALIQLMQWHYIRAARPQLYKLLASANVIGAPMSVLHHLGLGVWSFLAGPAQGIIDSAQGGTFNVARLLGGFVEGFHNLTSNIILAVTTSIAKAASAVRRGFAILGLDMQEATGVSSRQRSQGEAALHSLPPSGHVNFPSAIIAACTGLVRQPLGGLREGGVTGLLRGVIRGSLGLLILPMNSLLGTLASLSGAIRDGLLGPDVLPPRLRPPRHVSSRQPLSLYCWIEALGRALLRSLEAGKFAQEGFLACRQLLAPSEYLILTRAHILVVAVPHMATSRWQPSLQWAVGLGDIELCKTSSQELSVLSMQPELSMEESQVLMARRRLGLKLPGRSPWTHHSADFEIASDAEQVAHLVKGSRDQIVHNHLLPALRGGCLGSAFWQLSLLQDDVAQQHARAVYAQHITSMVEQITSLPSGSKRPH